MVPTYFPLASLPERVIGITNDETVTFDVAFPSPFDLMLQAIPTAETGSVRLEWLNDELHTRLFEITESSHPLVVVGDRVLIVAGPGG